MQQPSTVPIIALLAVPAITMLVLGVGRINDKTRSIALMAALLSELAISLIGGLAPSELVTISPWGQALGYGNRFFLLLTSAGMVSIVLLCVGMATIVAMRWQAIHRQESLSIAGSLLATALLALAGNLLVASLAIVLFAMLKQMPDLEPGERLKQAAIDVATIAALLIADVLLRSSNETGLLGFQKVKGAALVSLAISSLLLLAQSRLQAKMPLQRQLMGLAALTMGGLLWLEIVHLATGSFLLEPWFLSIALIGALISAWLYFEGPSESSFYQAGNYWASLLLCSGLIRLAQPQVSVALYMTSVLVTTVSVCCSRQGSGGNGSRILQLSLEWGVSGLPGVVSGLSTLALMAALQGANEWAATGLLFTGSSIMLAGAWRRQLAARTEKADQPEAASRRLVIQAVILLVFVVSGLLPQLSSLPGSRLLLTSSLPLYPPLSSWLVYLLWLTPVLAGLGLALVVGSAEPRLYRDRGAVAGYLKPMTLGIGRRMSVGIARVERALEADWFMPWLFVWLVVISLLLRS